MEWELFFLDMLSLSSSIYSYVKLKQRNATLHLGTSKKIVPHNLVRKILVMPSLFSATDMHCESVMVMLVVVVHIYSASLL